MSTRNPSIVQPELESRGSSLLQHFTQPRQVSPGTTYPPIQKPSAKHHSETSHHRNLLSDLSFTTITLILCFNISHVATIMSARRLLRRETAALNGSSKPPLNRTITLQMPYSPFNPTKLPWRRMTVRAHATRVESSNRS